MIESPVRAKCRYPNIQFRIGLRFSRVYDAFGNDLSVSGSWKSPFAYAGQFGYQQDVDTGLKLLGHRYYDSDTGRFLTRDPIKDGRNWYGYCENNPIRRYDPAGLLWHDPLVISVDKNFKGQVTAIGEPGPGQGSGSVVVPPGYHSDPRMDVDYLLIQFKDGHEELVFPWGWGTPVNGDNTPQPIYLSEKGTLSGWLGPVSQGGDFTSIFWVLNANAGLENDISSSRPSRPGKYHRAERELMLPRDAEGPLINNGRHDLGGGRIVRD